MSWVKPGYDVVIIGSGPGGSTLAHGLSRRGLNVLVVESGSLLEPDPSLSGQDAVLMQDVQARRGPRFVGGDSKFYGAALYRLREKDFQSRPTEHGESADWPISYADLEPYYTEAERLYSVHGSPEGDPSEPPRSEPYPYGPIPHEPFIANVVERIRGTGVPVAYIPKGLDVRPGGKCVLCSTCDSYYCQRDAKMDAEVAALRPALKTGRVELVTQTRCLKVHTSADGRRATGVLLRRGTEEVEVQAGVVAVSGGLISSPALLWRSRSDAHPNGIGNASGALGRYMAGHTAGFLFPVLGLKKLPRLHQKTFAINAFYEPSESWPYGLGVIQATGQIPIWKYLPAPMRPFVKPVAERSLMCILMTESVGTKDTGLTFSDTGAVKTRMPTPSKKTYRRLRQKAAALFRAAGCAFVYASGAGSSHGVGTVRMGRDPATSVLDGECRVHGMDNLYVVDSSSLPSAGAVNTTLTIAALSLRTAEAIARAQPAAARERVA